MLDPALPQPLYHQLATLLATGIERGEYPAGERLPSEHQLAERFGLGRPTVRQATDVLVRRGLLERRRGSGTYVRQPSPRVDLFSLSGTHDAFRHHAQRVETSLLSPLARTEVAAAAEGNPFAGSDALHVARLSRLSRTPVLLEHIYMDAALFAPLLDEDLEGQSLSHLVETRLHLRPESADQSFSVQAVRGKTARALGVAAGSELLYVQRYLNFRNQPQAVYVELRCRTDRMTFTQHIEGADHG